jgi:hypothetical protein
MGPIKESQCFLMGAATFFKPAKPLETKPPPVTLKPKAPLKLLELEVPPFVLELGGPLTAIGSEVPGTVFKPDAIRVSWVATAEAITRGIVFLLSLKDFSDAMLASNGHFTPIFQDPPVSSQGPSGASVQFS